MKKLSLALQCKLLNTMRVIRVNIDDRIIKFKWFVFDARKSFHVLNSKFTQRVRRSTGLVNEVNMLNLSFGL